MLVYHATTARNAGHIKTEGLKINQPGNWDDIRTNDCIFFAFSAEVAIDYVETSDTYDDSRIVHFNDIINWLIIHKSDQLKGIASDKYLACKYVKMKIGKNLCPQRIGVYDTIEEIDFEKLIKMGNVVLKVSNGNSDTVFHLAIKIMLLS